MPGRGRSNTQLNLAGSCRSATDRATGSAILQILQNRQRQFGGAFMRLFIATILLGLFASVGAAAAADWMGWSVGISGGGGTGTSTQTDSEIPCGAFGTCCPKIVPEVSRAQGVLRPSSPMCR